MPHTDDTIAAIATPNGAGGIGIVRVSGPHALAIAAGLTGKKPKPRIVHFSTFCDDQGGTIDRGLAIYFAAPRSFTGEDVLELHTHGSPVVLDLLLACSFSASVLVFLSAVQVRRAGDFSVFPSLLLLLTLFRLSLNIASSRRILLHGGEGTAAAGSVIEAFGQFVVGGNYVVGFVLFLALIAIQFLVVSHGAVRTAEVTARFTLYRLPTIRDESVCCSMRVATRTF